MPLLLAYDPFNAALADQRRDNVGGFIGGCVVQVYDGVGEQRKCPEALGDDVLFVPCRYEADDLRLPAYPGGLSSAGNRDG